ncbi:M20 family metallo-hydrolase [Oceanobacillus sp. FSL K6-2867]|uniref:M20 family metallo-hydrolase n=1 Tax=Oceanobacillus sp. FSL K6-2867 TaxID=2954748 RepID=UPI0030D8CC5A
MSIDRAWLEEKLLELNLTDRMDVPEGFSRLSFSQEEKRAHQQFINIAQELGLETHQDEAGNQWAIWKAAGDDQPNIAVGSHLDTVYSGGGYDGVAGVLTGLAAIKQLKDLKFKPEKNIAIICFVSEESARFGVSTVGSKAIAGMLDKEEIASLEDKDGVTFKQAIDSFGVDWESIEKAEVPTDKIESFLELHIEQGSILEEAGVSIGIVNGIACPVRLKVNVKGMANHTGTTPMDRRKDALVICAPLFNFVHDKALEVNKQAEVPLVATVSTVKLKPNAMNVIPGEVELGIDIRSVDDTRKRNFADDIRAYCRDLAEKHGVTVEVATLVDNDSVLLDGQIHEKIEAACQSAGLTYISMNSGAGHDVMNMAAKWPSGLLFIPCRDGLSHHPKEHTEVDDLAKGTAIIVNYLQAEAGA